MGPFILRCRVDQTQFFEILQSGDGKGVVSFEMYTVKSENQIFLPLLFLFAVDQKNG